MVDIGAVHVVGDARELPGRSNFAKGRPRWPMPWSC